MDYRRFSVSRRQKEPLLAFILSSLKSCGCRILRYSGAGEAPFRISFEAPDGERIGIIAYAFLANSRVTRNRPADEHRFQVKYGPNTGELHELWQDPFGLYTTLFFGINPEEGFFVAADPVVHSPTRFFISVELKQQHVDQILRKGWHAWERQKRGAGGLEEPVEVMVGGTPQHFLRYVRFERTAKGLDTGHRDLLAHKMAELRHLPGELPQAGSVPLEDPRQAHHLARELELTQDEILDLIESAPRLKMAVRGWVAEAHLRRQLEDLPIITECVPIEEDGRPDLKVSLAGSRPILIECKNVLRKAYADGSYRLDFQRTRAAKGDPCSRYYDPEEFEVVAACLHPQTEHWEFAFALSAELDPHDRCPGKLSNRVRVDHRWDTDVIGVLGRALAG